MEKWEIWYSWYYEDLRAHAGNNSFEFESENKPSNKELLRHIADNGLSPCGIECISIDHVRPLTEHTWLTKEEDFAAIKKQ